MLPSAGDDAVPTDGRTRVRQVHQEPDQAGAAEADEAEVDRAVDATLVSDGRRSGVVLVAGVVRALLALHVGALVGDRRGGRGVGRALVCDELCLGEVADLGPLPPLGGRVAVGDLAGERIGRVRRGDGALLAEHTLAGDVLAGDRALDDTRLRGVQDLARLDRDGLGVGDVAVRVEELDRVLSDRRARERDGLRGLAVLDGAERLAVPGTEVRVDQTDHDALDGHVRLVVHVRERRLDGARGLRRGGVVALAEVHREGVVGGYRRRRAHLTGQLRLDDVVDRLGVLAVTEDVTLDGLEGGRVCAGSLVERADQGGELEAGDLSRAVGLARRRRRLHVGGGVLGDRRGRDLDLHLEVVGLGALVVEGRARGEPDLVLATIVRGVLERGELGRREHAVLDDDGSRRGEHGLATRVGDPVVVRAVRDVRAALVRTTLEIDVRLGLVDVLVDAVARLVGREDRSGERLADRRRGDHGTAVGVDLGALGRALALVLVVVHAVAVGVPLAGGASVGIDVGAGRGGRALVVGVRDTVTVRVCGRRGVAVGPGRERLGRAAGGGGVASTNRCAHHDREGHGGAGLDGREREGVVPAGEALQPLMGVDGRLAGDPVAQARDDRVGIRVEVDDDDRGGVLAGAVGDGHDGDGELSRLSGERESDARAGRKDRRENQEPESTHVEPSFCVATSVASMGYCGARLIPSNACSRSY